MCGIVALATTTSSRLHPSPSTLRTQLASSLSLIAHRGPDGSGIWISPDTCVALAHCRLAINDLSPSGCQPLHSPDGSIHAIVNGELYDHIRLRSECPEYAFAGTSDSELAIALYLKYGLGFLDHLRGEFALCLYDQRDRTFVAARDRYGIKPLFWRRDPPTGSVQFAAECKAFLPLGWEAEWDVGALVDGGWGQDTRTVFQGVQKLRPGHYLVIRDGGEPEIRPYWDIEYPSKDYLDPRSEPEMIAALRAHLVEAVRLRLRADVPVGIYLSGGIDSSALAGIATHLVKQQGEKMGSEQATEGRVACFSIAFDAESGFDESDIAQRTADHLGVDFHRIHMSESALASRFEDAVWHVEHHNHDLNFVGKYALSELPRSKGYPVVLTGEGADEQFAGYPLYLPDFLRADDPFMPDGMSDVEREAAVRRAVQDTKRSYDLMGGTSAYFRADERLSTPASLLAFTPPLSLFSKPWRESYAHFDPLNTVFRNIDGLAHTSTLHIWHPLHSALYIWQKGHLTNQFLSCLGDRVEMAHSIEARTPFLDHILTGYVNRLPPSLKLRKMPTSDGHVYVEKYALREAVRPYVTDEIYTRRKHPYSAPTTYPTGGPVHRVLERLVTREGVKRLGFVQWEEVQRLMRLAFGDAKEDAGRVWAWRNVLVVAEWIVLSMRFHMNPAER